jgi:cold shock CspA family protein
MSNTDRNTRLVAQVKWFNPSSGYGFATIKTPGEHHEEDIFVHHTSIQVDGDQYKYLKKGEYVNLSLEETETNDHKYQGVNIRGVLDGKLMCEILNEASANNSNNGEWKQQKRSRNHHNNNKNNRRD